ncbi:hypothetical protein H1C71_011789 [Ictidomys tridecemlineatus]|nr:hypothetical protein H1C71_011789 [Ictidomys tridecemlineatus]
MQRGEDQGQSIGRSVDYVALGKWPPPVLVFSLERGTEAFWVASVHDGAPLTRPLFLLGSQETALPPGAGAGEGGDSSQSALLFRPRSWGSESRASLGGAGSAARARVTPAQLGVPLLPGGRGLPF